VTALLRKLSFAAADRLRFKLIISSILFLLPMVSVVKETAVGSEGSVGSVVGACLLFAGGISFGSVIFSKI